MVDTALLAGRYRLIEPIGRGGMGEVWRAEDVALKRQVAIKVRTSPGLDYGAAAAGGAAAGVWREARDAAQLVHPNVVGIYDVADHGGRPFLVMELIEGQDLAALLVEHGPLPSAQVAQIGAQAARALAAAHAVGVVHRDVKPGNLLVTPEGNVKLTDFGIAGPIESAAVDPATVNPIMVHYAANDDVAVDTVAMDTSARRPAAHTARDHHGFRPRSRQVMGTGAYVAPERLVGSAAGPASDLYSLGCVLYELLIGHPPFPDDDPELAAHRHLQDEPEPPGRRRPDIPAELEHIVLRLLAKNPSDRPQDAGRVAVVLQAVADTPADPATPRLPPKIEAAPETTASAWTTSAHAPRFLYHDPHDDQDHCLGTKSQNRPLPAGAHRHVSRRSPRARLAAAAGIVIIAAVISAVVALS